MAFQLVAKDDPRCATHLHTYMFLLNEDDPKQSILEAADRFCVESRSKDDELESDFLSRGLCEGQLATLWGDEGFCVITVTPALEILPASESCGVPLRILPRVAIISQFAEGSGLVSGETYLCPFSGRFLVHGELEVQDEVEEEEEDSEEGSPPLQLPELYIFDVL